MLHNCCFLNLSVSKADVIRMGDGEGKETTEKGKLETWCIVFHSKWNRSTCKQESTYIRPAGDFKELLINTTHKHSLERVLDLQSLSESLSLSSLNGSLSSCLDSLSLTLIHNIVCPELFGIIEKRRWRVCEVINSKEFWSSFSTHGTGFKSQLHHSKTFMTLGKLFNLYLSS